MVYKILAETDQALIKAFLSKQQQFFNLQACQEAFKNKGTLSINSLSELIGSDNYNVTAGNSCAIIQKLESNAELDFLGSLNKVGNLVAMKLENGSIEIHPSQLSGIESIPHKTNIDKLMDTLSCPPFIKQDVAVIIASSGLQVLSKSGDIVLEGDTENLISRINEVLKKAALGTVAVIEDIEGDKVLKFYSKSSWQARYSAVPRAHVLQDPEPDKYENTSIFEGRSYFLDSGQNRSHLLENAKHLISKFPCGRVLGLGQSPGWILEQCKLIDSDPGRFDLVAFSGGWYTGSTSLRLDTMCKPNKEDIDCYRKYLSEKKLEPLSIIGEHTPESPLVIVEHTHSGKGLKSFLEILTNWAKDLGVFDDLKTRLHVHLIVGEDSLSSHLPYVEPDTLFIRSIQTTSTQFVVDMSNAPDDLDRLVPHYAHHEWTKVDPFQGDFNITNIGTIRQHLIRP